MSRRSERLQMGAELELLQQDHGKSAPQRVFKHAGAGVRHTGTGLGCLLPDRLPRS
jgi:hypothetical protein